MELVDGLPPSVASIAVFLATKAKAYNNHLKWNEQAMFKADLMNVRHRWRTVDSFAFSSKCLSEGMRNEDVELLVGWLAKAQAGRRLVPSKSYRKFRFNPPPEETVFPAYSNDRW
ncbi:hypothetical protein [Cryobacterium sp. PH31-L1]|uniref:hypothetical protein n=1 Tax=Cryobacterium sp. PH31-L1 TaxID=3046199 RepID=UPI0024BA049E|nr:hypothetical protein [Cryobacterium sp. PH31-L1]MDJ0379203.1 hypothetical protein [Cryobacterium sp. PH31-L1]